jgi:hypothetical protein
MALLGEEEQTADDLHWARSITAFGELVAGEQWFKEPGYASWVEFIGLNLSVCIPQIVVSTKPRLRTKRSGL